MVNDGWWLTVWSTAKGTCTTWAAPLRRLARYVDAALAAAEEDVAASPDEETRYVRHRKYFRRTPGGAQDCGANFWASSVALVMICKYAPCSWYFYSFETLDL